MLQKDILVCVYEEVLNVSITGEDWVCIEVNAPAMLFSI